MDQDCEQAAAPARRGFYNPYLAPPRGGAAAQPHAAAEAAEGDAAGRGKRGRGAAESYCTAVSSFRFIAPRCLDEDGGEDEDDDDGGGKGDTDLGAAAAAEGAGRRRGVHIGTAERAPKVYRDGEEHDVLDFAGHSCWPRRVSVWAGRAAPERAALDPRFERFHVYDIVETTEYPSAGDASRFAAEARPGGATVVTLLGMSDDGKRVAVHVYGVRHYFFMEKAAVDLACNIHSEAQLADALVAALRTSALAAGAARQDAGGGEGGGGRRAGGYLGRASRESVAVSVVSAADVYFFDTRPQLFYRVASASARLGAHLCDNFLPGVTKYEGAVDATTRFLLDNEGFPSFGWYRLRPGRAGARVALRAPEQHATSCDVEVNCTADNLEPLADAADAAWPDYKLLCFDIECLSCTGDGRAFPAAGNPEDLVVQISCLTYSLRTQRHEHTLLFSLGSCDLPPAFLAACAAAGLPAPAVLEFDSEFELLLAFVTFLKQYSPEFVTGYNIVNFDWAYLAEKLTAVYDLRLDGYGKLNRGGVFRVSDAGQNRFQKQSKVKISGVVSLDMYRTAVEKLKLPSYKLNAVAEEALRERKVDLDYKDMPRHFAAGPAGRGVIGEYCIQDSALVGKLFFKYLPHLELSAVARLAGITVPRAIFDGQQIRVFTCLLRLARARGFLLPDNQRRFGGGGEGEGAADPLAGWAEAELAGEGGGEEEGEGGGEEEDAGEGGEEAAAAAKEGAGRAAAARPRAAGGRAVGYQGAKVLDPDSGFHVDPVMVLDFASLYPSIIQAHNLCFTTLVRDEAALAGLEPGADYATFVVGGRALRFVREHVRESLLSVLLRDWLAMRKAIRGRIPAAAPEEAVLLDKQQAAIKVVCNSVYGFTGVANGLLPCLPVAATVTTIGRDMLLETRRYVHERWAAPEALARDFPAAAAAAAAAGARYRVRVVYGDTDSVFVKFAGMPYEAVCALGDGMARQISAALFRPPIKLECEKTFAKLLLITKKKYLGLVGGGKMLMKGVDLVRKNNCRFINAYARRLVDVLMRDDEVSRAAAEASAVPPGEWPGRRLPPGFARFGAVLAEAYAKIADPALDLGDFVMTAELSRPPEAYANRRLAHLTVYYKLLLRSEARPSVKDRIPYVIAAPSEGVARDAAAVNALRGTGPPAPSPPASPPAPAAAPARLAAPRPPRLLVSDLAEDPGYARAHAVPLNTDYYFSHLLGTVGATFKALFGNDTRTTESLLRRFIPEARAACDRELRARLAAAGFAELTPAAQTRQTLRTAFGTLAGAPHQS
ncbi:DNA polymerase catalytic subunit [Cervid alphaherpesvirus 2]|uniref:DNA polymerase n=2 Tax=Cervid alphaherpesvirus 2 TaxID=365327 RepID=A0A455JIV1_9ALPH|nr:DNA polymerase catalytic subunit [Cervid alphaherpesvirus 2]AVT50749.1 DNA polymerase catalytic subunit [Cervid alphaherpesvirus 2]